MRNKLKWTALAAVLAVVAVSTAASADDGGVPKALNAIGSTLTTLVASVNQLSTSVAQLVTANAPTPGPTVLVTAPFLIQSGTGAACNLINAAPGTANVTAALVSSLTGQTYGNSSFSSPVLPGHSTGTSIDLGTTTPAFVYCRFEIDVPASQVRAQIQYRVDQKPTATADAR